MPGPAILINKHPHTLGECVYVARIKAGLTQAQLGTILGCYSTEIGAWETGRRQMQAQTFLRVMAACGWRIEARKNVGPVSQSAASRRTNAPRTVTQSTGDAACS
jgi:transcriptional regulator with XRE-family HTH domain